LKYHELTYRIFYLHLQNLTLIYLNKIAISTSLKNWFGWKNTSFSGLHYRMKFFGGYVKAIFFNDLIKALKEKKFKI